MPAPKLTKIKNWNECPLFMTIAQAENSLGFSRATLDAWVKINGFPVIKDGTQKIHRDLFKVWIDKRVGNGLEDVLFQQEMEINYQEKLNTTLEKVEDKLIKLCDDLTQKDDKEDLFKVMIKEFSTALKVKENI